MGLRPAEGDEKRLLPSNHFPSATTFHQNVTLSLSSRLPRYAPACRGACRGTVPGFPTSPLLPSTACVVLLKENHMQLTEAATLDRKSGEADLSRCPACPGLPWGPPWGLPWRDLRFHFSPRLRLSFPEGYGLKEGA